MPLWALFGLGVGGASLSYVVAFIVPELVRYLRDENAQIAKRRIFLVAALGVALVLPGGLLTMAVGAADVKAAIFTGAGWQTLLKGGIESIAAVSE